MEQELDAFVRKYVRGSGYRPDEVILAPDGAIMEDICAEVSVNLKIQYLMRQIASLEKGVVQNLFEGCTTVETSKLAGA